MDDVIENQEVQEDIVDQPEEEKSLRDQIVDAVAETKEPKSRGEDGKFAKKDQLKLDPIKSAELSVKAPEVKDIPAPASWKGEHRDKWKEVPRALQEAITQREVEVHQGFTKLDEDRNLGKQIKEVMTPYMPIIKQEGHTPAAAIQDLLNNAYVLRQGTPQQKAQLVQDIIQRYGVDLNMGQQQRAIDPNVQALQNQIAQMQQHFIEQNQLREQEENAKIQDSIQAFASSPDRPYFEQVKPIMASLLRAGMASDLQEAYDKAVKLDDTISQQMLSSHADDLARKRQLEIESKKKAAVSVSGSSSAIANAKTPDRSLREELEANFRSSTIN